MSQKDQKLIATQALADSLQNQLDCFEGWSYIDGLKYYRVKQVSIKDGNLVFRLDDGDGNQRELELNPVSWKKP